ncbi:serpentine type 7TM GPCR chemoreceptor srt domain-containing protein [Ditylenchus destructor]|nr:serpentine type 7TM GPCR chemoreceptor srt domain-containing protein [Ditylenchus destructor]
MEMYFFRHAEWERLYNCSLYQVDDVPLENRQHVFLGTTFIILSIIFMTLYIPCIIAVRKHIKKNTCYKFLFFLGIVDILTIPANGIMTGYMAIVGTVFCSHPTFLYFSGPYGIFFWIIESTTAILLALNRCIEILSPNLADTLYRGGRTWLWMIPPVLYGLYFALFTKPVMFNGIYMAWFGNPHIGYIDDPEGITYGNHLHSFHNILVCFSLTALYFFFIFAFVYKAKSMRHSINASGSGAKVMPHKAAFIQVFLISIFNVVGASLYIYMQYIYVAPWLIITAQTCWLIIHGMPSIFFLVVNKTIRNECIRMISGGSKVATTSHLSNSNADRTHKNTSVDKKRQKETQQHQSMSDY